MRIGQTLRVVFLYPGSAAEDDYPAAAALIDAEVDFDVVHTTIAEDAHREDALRDVGDLRRLCAALETVDRSRLASVVWACTSGSFIFGADGAREQVAAVTAAAGVPASSTSLAFLDALAALQIRDVAVAATYPADITASFVAFLATEGVRTHNAGAFGIITAAEVGQLDAKAVIRFAAQHDVAEAKAVLLPDTALHTVRLLPELEAELGKPVLTANQVTVWQGLRLAQLEMPSRPALGHLFASPVAAA